MKLGIFDSGLGGLVIAKSIRAHFPNIDLVYFGDTLNVPYGNKSRDTIYGYSKRAVEFLFEQDCALIITACNTVSASALRQLQQIYLPNSAYADRRILGVVVPTLETALDAGYKRLGVIGTSYTISSNVYPDELKKLDPDIDILQQKTPLLVPMIENEGLTWVEPILKHYLEPIIAHKAECLILGCTHYPYLRPQISGILGAEFPILAQDDIIPAKLDDYLNRHRDIKDKITFHGNADFLISDVTDSYINAAQDMYDEAIHVEAVHFDSENECYKRVEK